MIFKIINKQFISKRGDWFSLAHRPAALGAGKSAEEEKVT